MTNELYEIYKRNFSFNIRAKETELAILNHKDNCVLKEQNNDGELIGVSLINGSTILLLCVDEGYRNRGIGTNLLKESEALIRSNGHSTVNIGVGFDYLMPGVPLIGDNQEFFSKRGYIHSWKETECFDMAMTLSDIHYKADINSVINGILYRFADIDDLKQIKECVDDAEINFTKFYMNENLYDASNSQKVLIALKDHEVCGTLIVSAGTEAPNTGSVGCTTTKNKFRHQKIASNLVRVGSCYLKDIGLKYGFLGYTYTGLDRLYGSAGYHITTKYLMAQKNFRAI